MRKLNKKYIKNLQQKKYRDLFGEFIIEGKKGVNEALAIHAQIKLIIVNKNIINDPDISIILKKAEACKLPIELYNDRDTEYIKNSASYPGISAILKKNTVEFAELFDNGPIICLDTLQDPGNLGTIIRTADWFGFKNIVVTLNCVDIYNTKVVQSTMGSIFHVNIYKSDNIINDLQVFKERGYKISILTTDGNDYKKLPTHNKQIYIFGNESNGVRKEIARMGDIYAIPGKGSAESLNVAVSVGIILSSIFEKTKK